MPDRSYYRTIYRPYQTYRNGVLIEQGPAWQCGYESLWRSPVVKGERDGEDGFRFPNSYRMLFILDDRPYGSWTISQWGAVYEYKLGLGYLMNDLYWGNRVAPETPFAAENTALIEAMTKLKDQKIDLLTALAEHAQTAGLIESTARRIATGITEMYRGLRKGRINKRSLRRAFNAIGHHSPRKGFHKTLASQILEFQYGVRPLLADVHGACEAIAKVRYHDRVGSPVRVSGRVTSGDKTVRSAYPVGQQGPGLLPGTAYDTSYTETKVVLWFSCSNTVVKNFSDLGFTNPLATVWEKVPFSFMVDWALPMGDWLKALDANYGMEFRGGCTTVWTERRIEYHGADTKNNGVTKLEGRYIRREMNRTAYRTLPIPYPPTLKNPVSMEHALNALALLTGLAPEARELQKRARL